LSRAHAPMNPTIAAFFDEPTNTVSYVVADAATRRAAIVDPLLDFDPSAARTSTTSADHIVAFVRAGDFAVDWILETHVHADHFSAAQYLKSSLGGKVGIGWRITDVQETFADIYNAPAFKPDGSQFDHLFRDGETFSIGGIEARAIHTPGHTPACMTYLIGDAAFVGDTLFMPDYGTARTDFPGGDARELYRSIRKIYALPDSTRILLCHDYKASGRNEYEWETTVGEQKAKNIHLRAETREDDFVRMRLERDRKLAMPRLMLAAVQVNMRAGHFPPAESNGARYLKLPVDRF